MMTINISDEKILKDALMQDIFLEDDSPVKVYKKIGGLTNLGKTFFYCEREISEKEQYAQAQMLQKYGAEIYGSSAQLATQHSNGTSSSTGTGSAVSGGGTLIKCSVSKLADLSYLKEASGGGDYGGFDAARKKLLQYLVDGKKDKDWLDKHKDVDIFITALNEFRQGSGPTGSDNAGSRKTIEELLKKEPWKSDYRGKVGGFDKLMDNYNKTWEAFAGPVGKKDGGKSGESHLGGSSVGNGEEWTPNQSWRIDIQTNFGEEWYKRKFKSGFLNKILFTIKDEMRAHTSQQAKTDMTDHKYTADEMLPQDKRKLDSLQWKMTNKVAKDYITYLLGWSRKKEKKMEDGKPIPVESKLKQDSGFGASMAKKALGNRGILGRLKQKIFAGGQSNNVISVAFQMADPNDGWKLVDEKDDGTTGGTTGGTEGSGSSGGGASGSGGNGAGKGQGSSGGSGGQNPGKGGGMNAAMTPQEVRDYTKVFADGEDGEKNMNNLKGLSGRVARLEDVVYGESSEDEKEDPFADLFLEDGRLELARRTCLGDVSAIDELLDFHLGQEEL